MKTLGKKIRLLRHQKGWSQEEVAKRLDISIPAFSKIETGITDINLITP
jgi:transcriptional regulator with XRE-family HTH domain